MILITVKILVAAKGCARSIRVHSWFQVILFTFAVATSLSLSVFAQDGQTGWNSAVRLGGCGGLYLLAEPEKLEELRAMLEACKGPVKE